jgi:hypothetical protein
MTISSRILRSDTDLEHFIERFVASGGNPIPMEYLRHSTVRGFFRDGTLVGGYAINRTVPFRYADWIPEPTRAELIREGSFDGRDSAEVSCFWMAKGGLQKFQRTGVYVRLVIDAFRTGARWVVGGSVVPSVARIQKQALPARLYLGPTTLGRIGEVYAATRWTMVGKLVLAAIRIYGRGLLTPVLGGRAGRA